MDAVKREALEKAGFKVGTVEEFLDEISHKPFSLGDENERKLFGYSTKDDSPVWLFVMGFTFLIPFLVWLVYV